jgi:gliding motility-associated-like protein
MYFRKQILIVLTALAFTLTGKSQCISINLIKNPNLEDYSCCPTELTMITCANYWYQPLLDGSTSDYFNICGIDSLTHPDELPYFLYNYFGNGYAGINTNTYTAPMPPYREYIQGTLSKPLIIEQCYYCSFWVKLFNFKNTGPFTAIDAIGIFFSDTLPKKHNTELLAYYFPAQINNPSGRIITDTNNWTQITGTFVANGGEKYFTVGTFKQENEINMIYFLSPPTIESYYFFDNFSLCPCEDTIPPPNNVYIPNVFSPNRDGKNDKFYIRGVNIKEIDMKVYNRWGNLVYVSKDVHEGWDGRYKSNDCAEGVYFYIAEVTFADGTISVKKGNVTLIR